MQRLNSTLAQHHNDLTTILTAGSDQARDALQQILRESQDSLDDSLRTAIEQGKDVLVNERGALEVTLLKCVQALNLALRRLLILLCVLALAVVATYGSIRGRQLGESWRQISLQRFLPVLMGCVVAGAIGFIATIDNFAPPFAQRTKASYTKNLSERSFAKSLFFAEQTVSP